MSNSLTDSTFQLGETPLTLQMLYQVAVRGAKVYLSDKAKSKIDANRKSVDAILSRGETVYGLNTGFGRLARVTVPPEQLEQLQVNIIRSHCCGVGPALDVQAARAMMLLRAAVLSHGYSGVRSDLPEHILNLLNHDVVPVVPIQGSVGASGDLAPLAHLALGLIGEGEVFHKGIRKPAAQVYAELGIQPIKIAAKEGLALVNGTQFMTAIGSIVVIESLLIMDLADVCGAVSLEGLRGSVKPFEEALQALRPHAGQMHSARNLRLLLHNSKNVASHTDCDKVQDAYSLRCMPQVHGASRDVLSHVRSVVETEMNSVTDNPIVFDDNSQVLSGGNFHGQPVALALDYLAMGLSEIGSISERRTEQLVNPALSGLPTFLTPNPGLHSGFMIAQVTAAALASENKTLCHPASVDSISTNADQEDHVSMGAFAAVKLRKVLENVRTILAIELMCGCQALDLKPQVANGPGVEAARSLVRAAVPKLTDDRVLTPDIETIRDLIGKFEFSKSIEDRCPGLQLSHPWRPAT